eukprot:gene31838-41316_t
MGQVSKRTIMFFAMTLFLLVLIPLIALAFQSSFLRPITIKDLSIKGSLKNSIALSITHISCLASLSYAAADIFLDYLTQNVRMYKSLRFTERTIFLLALMGASIVFLSCQSLDCFATIYYGTNFAVNILIGTALYSVRGVVVRVISIAVLLAGMFRWVYLVRSRQNFRNFRIDRLNTEEFSFFMYSVPPLILSPLPMVWRVIVGEEWLKAHNIEIIIFDMSVRYVMFAFILIVPGRVVRLMTEMRFSDVAQNELIRQPPEVDLAMAPIILE